MLFECDWISQKIRVPSENLEIQFFVVVLEEDV